MTTNIIELASKQPGFLGVESARTGMEITASHWTYVESIKKWQEYFQHSQAQIQGREKWYTSFKTKIAGVLHDKISTCALILNKKS